VLRQTLLAVIAVAVLAGCGGEPDAALSSADRAAIQKRYAAYTRDVLAADGPRVCAQFTPASRKHSDQIAREAGYYDCGEIARLALSLGKSDAPDDIRERLAHPERIDVSMHGQKALASFPGVTAQGAFIPLELERVGQRWLIDASRVITR
jgi:hypothetical protein